MSSYAWVITVDHLYDPEDGLPSRVGTQGPHDATEQQLAKAAEGREWRVLDDDGIVYYEGRLWSEEPGSELDFGPLWDFGTPDAGAVVIQYRDEGEKWVTL